MRVNLDRPTTSVHENLGATSLGSYYEPWAQLGRGLDIARQIDIPGGGNLAESGASDCHDW
jgi:hypothetical protein